MNFQKLAALAATVAALIVSACGGGGGGGGIGGTGVSTDVAYGTITAMGSIWVNGVEYDVTNASIDDGSGSQSDLKVGMVVQVDGSIADQRADAVTREGSLKGFVETVTLDANRMGTMRVMGQTVQVDERTQFAGGVLPAANDRVEVHGLVVSAGTIAAGYVERKTAAPTPPFAVKGLVSNHVPAGSNFRIGALVVRYSGASVSDLGAGSWNGKLVEVKGTACAGAVVCGTLTASTVKAGGVQAVNGAKAEVEGYVTSLGAGSFVIGTQPVTTSAATVFEGGTLAEVLAGSQLEVEGTIRNGVLQAAKVQFKDAVRIEADVATVSATSFTLAGLPGITVRVNDFTEFKGGTTLADLSPGDHLRLRGRPSLGQRVVATEVEARSADSRTLLQAPVDAVNAPRVTLRGVVVDTSPIAEAEFKGPNGLSGRTAFFAAVKVGALVKARGTRSGNVVAWDQIELED